LPLLKFQPSYINKHKGPVLRPRFIGPGRARTQIPFVHSTQKFHNSKGVKNVLAQFLNIGNDGGMETQRECRRRRMQGGGITEIPELGFRVILVWRVWQKEKVLWIWKLVGRGSGLVSHSLGCVLELPMLNLGVLLSYYL